jgi:serine/threonine protein phosphatase 1
MLLDFLDGQSTMWLTPVTGGERTFEQYTGLSARVHSEADVEEMRRIFAESFPDEHLQFMQNLPFYYEDDHAIYVHAGLDEGKHPRESSQVSLLWMRDMDFYKNYRGKPCVFGHTPTPLLPLRGRLGRHGIYISHSAVGLDTGYNHHSPLSCLSLPDFNLFQTFADGREETHQITSFIPETLREMQRRAGLAE